MPPLSSLRPKARANGASASAAASAPCPVRGGGATIAAIAELTRLSDRMDALLRDAAFVRSQRDYDRLADEGRSIAGEIDAAFRGSGTAQNPPRWQRGGKAVW